ncbi:hypothetical protein GOB15_07155 [Sinorhizobium meliloti]|nr:hypothetical protein [Sinorhizobium meliloti]MDW9509449.1 hypothetical protein [Sinorhizobium meliloti]MDX0772226.1 hypothetical protein [Sinorhizobium medicae]MDX0906698.1 hypothetical protein [Sinorhizobium medicae]MDX1164220.1 hypothetical protein [Sinorhizobium medicae]
MADSDPFDRRLSILLKEWDHLQFHIGRLDTIAFNVRQWCVTVFTAFLGVAATLKRPEVILLALVPVVLFWLTDSLWKAIQKKFINRAWEVEQFIASEEFDRAVVERSLASFETPLISAQFGSKTFISRAKDVLRAGVIPSVLLSYATIVICCLISYLVLLLSVSHTAHDP